MTTTTTYKGSCHCGSVQYEADLDLSQPVIACNCSMCGRSGTLLSFVPPEQFRLLSGESDLRNYEFNKHKIKHVFCQNCGIKPFARGEGPHGPMVAINTRCLENVDIASLTVHNYDGKNT